MRTDPYCSNCGYSLSGATESSKCPECGKPLVEVLTRDPLPGAAIGIRRRSQQLLFGLPLIDVAFGPHGQEPSGHARGVIAVGEKATGVIAIGGRAIGLFAFGGMAIGGVAFGGLGIGLVTCGGCALGLLMAMGGLALGWLACGGVALGGIAVGGLALGLGSSNMLSGSTIRMLTSLPGLITMGLLLTIVSVVPGLVSTLAMRWARNQAS